MRARRRGSFGKYRIVRKLSEGGFAVVYEALDTIEGIRVALKIPHAHLVGPESLAGFRKEARTQATLDHPHILPLKNAEFIGAEFVLAYPMGTGTLADRMKRRMGLETYLDLADQILSAAAHAHDRRVIHCDIKPDNFIVFPDQHLRLTDFGIARVSLRTVDGSGSGTIGYVAPEQAMGRPSFRSDVFSLGLILYEMLARELPAWPFEWPPPGFARIRRRLHPDYLRFLQSALEPDPRRRYPDAVAMHTAFQRLVPLVRRHASLRRGRKVAAPPPRDWKQIRFRQFRRAFRAHLELTHSCGRCEGPMSEFMTSCPWCGKKIVPAKEPTRLPGRCGRCRRGRKQDWVYCAWCHGPRFPEVSRRSYTDKRYVARCDHADCRGPLLKFSRYCPWCRRKVKRTWTLKPRGDKCPSCAWGVSKEFWEYCPWCTSHLPRQPAARKSR